MRSLLAECRLTLLKTAALLWLYSAAACDTVVVIVQCNEILLRAALAATNSVAFSLSALLRLNALVGIALAARRFSREEADRRRHSRCCTWPPSRTSGDDVCSPLCWGGGTSVGRVKFVRSVLPAVPALCRCALSVCSTILALIHAAPSVLCVNFRPGVSSIVTVCGCIRPVLLTVLTVTAYCTQLFELPSL